MSDIYRQHDAAFAAVSAYVILDGANERAATIAFKFPRDGAGRLYCYLHVIGVRMTRGYASGGGYDKKTAAASVAARQIPDADSTDRTNTQETIDAIRKALAKDSGYDWSRELENAGFKVWQAV